MSDVNHDAVRIRWDLRLDKFVTLVDHHPVFENQVSAAFADGNPDRFLDVEALKKRLAKGVGTALERAFIMSDKASGDWVTVGVRVKVKHEQSCLGAPKYPGRIGTVLEENQFGRPDGLWYVKLDATKRAKERVESFWSRDLEELKEEKDDGNP